MLLDLLLVWLAKYLQLTYIKILIYVNIFFFRGNVLHVIMKIVGLPRLFRRLVLRYFGSKTESFLFRLCLRIKFFQYSLSIE